MAAEAAVLNPTRLVLAALIGLVLLLVSLRQCRESQNCPRCIWLVRQSRWQAARLSALILTIPGSGW